MSEPDVSDLISVERAIQILDSTPVTPRVTEVPLDEAQGLRLAADLAADRDYPPFDKSQMDGIACRAADLRQPLDVIGEIPAGAWPSRPVGPNQALRIMTGAPLPQGADTVVPVEFLTSPTPSTTRATKPFNPGHAIARRGSEVRAGNVVLPANTLFGPSQLAVAATIGAARVNVFARPRVAVLTTGDEVVHYSQSPGPAQIRNSNSVMLAALLWNRGCDVTDLGIAPDHPDALRAALSEGLTYDALFVTGGMSMGDYDYVPAILKELGVTPHITKLKIKPGKPFLFATAPRRSAGQNGDAALFFSPPCYVFGLPGNPVSSFVCTTLLASRLIARMTGADPTPRTSTKTLATPLPPNGPREFYQPVRLAPPPADTAHPLTWKGSADVFTLATAHALLRREENAPALPAGSPVTVLHF